MVEGKREKKNLGDLQYSYCHKKEVLEVPGEKNPRSIRGVGRKAFLMLEGSGRRGGKEKPRLTCQVS